MSHVKKTEGKSWMDWPPLRDKAISYRAKGLLMYMLSCVQEWSFSIAGLASMATDGVQSVSTALHELEQAGYVQRTRGRNDDGTFGPLVYIISDRPAFAPAPEPQAPKPVTGRPDAGSPDTAGPKPGSSPLRNKNNKKEEYKENKTPARILDKASAYGREVGSI